MKPGHGEVLIAEGDVEVAEDEELLVRSSAASSTRACGPPCPNHAAGRREAQMVRAFEEIPRDTDRVIFFPRAAGGAERWEATGHDAARFQRHGSSSSRCCGTSAARRSEALERHRARRRADPRRGYDPGRERRAEQRARQLLRVVRERGGVGDVPRPRLHPRVGRHGPGPRAGARGATRAAARPTPTWSTPTSRSSPTCRRRASCSTSTASSSRTRRGPYGSARLPDSDDVLAKWMALTGDEQRLIAAANLHLPGRQVDPKQVRRDLWRLEPVGARAPAPHAAPARRARRPESDATSRARSPSVVSGPMSTTGFDLKHRSRLLAGGPVPRRRPAPS